MFSKSKINDPAPHKDADAAKTATPQAPAQSIPAQPKPNEFKASAPKAKPPASLLSADLHVTGNMKTTGDINVEGTVEGDIRAHLLTIGETATIKGEVVADDVVIKVAVDMARPGAIRSTLAASGRSAEPRRQKRADAKGKPGFVRAADLLNWKGVAGICGVFFVCAVFPAP